MYHLDAQKEKAPYRGLCVALLGCLDDVLLREELAAGKLEEISQNRTLHRHGAEFRIDEAVAGQRVELGLEDIDNDAAVVNRVDTFEAQPAGRRVRLGERVTFVWPA